MNVPVPSTLTGLRALGLPLALVAVVVPLVLFVSFGSHGAERQILGACIVACGIAIEGCLRNLPRMGRGSQAASAVVGLLAGGVAVDALCRILGAG